MKRDFFIGWQRPTRGSAVFLALSVALFVAVFAATAYVTAAAQRSAGDGSFRWDWGRQTVTGRLTARPYPHLTVVESERFAPGTSLILGGPGKVGVVDRAAPLDGQTVTAEGIMLTRGDLLMLQVAGNPDALRRTDGAHAPEPLVEPLGRWRLSGEICDGKCYAGAMRPGTGIAHKACANMCLIGGQPPVFVTLEPVEGHAFFLMGATGGGPLPETVLDYSGELVVLEGEIERRDGLPVVLIDPASVRSAR